MSVRIAQSRSSTPKDGNTPVQRANPDCFCLGASFAMYSSPRRYTAAAPDLCQSPGPPKSGLAVCLHMDNSHFQKPPDMSFHGTSSQPSQLAISSVGLKMPGWLGNQHSAEDRDQHGGKVGPGHGLWPMFARCCLP